MTFLNALLSGSHSLTSQIQVPLQTEVGTVTHGWVSEMVVMGTSLDVTQR